MGWGSCRGSVLQGLADGEVRKMPINLGDFHKLVRVLYSGGGRFRRAYFLIVDHLTLELLHHAALRNTWLDSVNKLIDKRREEVLTVVINNTALAHLQTMQLTHN